MKNDLKNEARNKNSFGKGRSAFLKRLGFFSLGTIVSCNNANP